MTELAAVAQAQIGGFLIELKNAIELRAAEFQALLDGGIVAGQTGILAGIGAVFQCREKGLAAVLAVGADAIGAGQAGGALTGIGQVEIAVLSTEKTGAAGDVVQLAGSLRFAAGGAPSLAAPRS